jgi:predicted aspartyl protease
MENATIGRVVVEAKIENLLDRDRARRGEITPEEVRSVVTPNALVDTGATRLSLPFSMIEKLGLEKFKSSQVRTAGGVREVGLYGPVWLTVQDRYCIIDVADLPEDCPVLIGQVPLELMDWVVGPKGQRLIGNPEHGGEWMSDMFWRHRGY